MRSAAVALQREGGSGSRSGARRCECDLAHIMCFLKHAENARRAALKVVSGILCEPFVGMSDTDLINPGLLSRPAPLALLPYCKAVFCALISLLVKPFAPLLYCWFATVGPTNKYIVHGSPVNRDSVHVVSVHGCADTGLSLCALGPRT